MPPQNVTAFYFFFKLTNVYNLLPNVAAQTCLIDSLLDIEWQILSDLGVLVCFRNI